MSRRDCFDEWMLIVFGAGATFVIIVGILICSFFIRDLGQALQEDHSYRGHRYEGVGVKSSIYYDRAKSPCFENVAGVTHCRSLTYEYTCIPLVVVS